MGFGRIVVPLRTYDRINIQVSFLQVPKLSSAAEYFFKVGVEGKRFRPTV